MVSSLREYSERLTDAGFWRPYVRAVLARHRLPDPGGIEAGFAGTYPTFLVGGAVVKLFGYFPSWQPDRDAELAALRVLADRPGVAVPRFLTGYGWPVAEDFPRRAMSAALGHQFDLFAGVRDRLRLARYRTLDDLAAGLWSVPTGLR